MIKSTASMFTIAVILYATPAKCWSPAPDYLPATLEGYHRGTDGYNCVLKNYPNIANTGLPAKQRFFNTGAWRYIRSLYFPENFGSCVRASSGVRG